MAAETTTYTPKKLFAGDIPAIATEPCTIVSGQTLDKYTIVESNSAGKMKAHSGTQTILVAGVTVFDALVPAADQANNLYTSGCFFADQLVFPSSASTDLLKRKLLEGSNIRAIFQTAGEV